MDRHDDRSGIAGLDDLLRRALEPEPATVKAVVARALHAEAGARAPRPRDPAARLIRALAAAAVVLLVGVAVGTIAWRSGSAPAPTKRGTIANQGDIIVLIAPDGPITLIGPGSATALSPRGTASIVLLGEPQ